MSLSLVIREYTATMDSAKVQTGSSLPDNHPNTEWARYPVCAPFEN